MRYICLVVLGMLVGIPSAHGTSLHARKLAKVESGSTTSPARKSNTTVKNTIHEAEVSGIEPVGLDRWRGNMRDAAQVLRDAFPFLYSKGEFESKENRDQVLSYIERLRKVARGLPLGDGKKFIVNEPLIDAYQSGIAKALGDAGIAYRGGRYDDARKGINSAIQRCFACHTAYQMGPQDPKFNVEVDGFNLGEEEKAIVLVALRQFVAANRVLEDALFEKPVSKERQDRQIEILKLHLLVSARGLQNPTQSLALVNEFTKHWQAAGVSFTHGEVWIRDLAFWAKLPGDTTSRMKMFIEYRDSRPQSERSGDGAYVKELMWTMLLHQSLPYMKMPTALANTYRMLGEAYHQLGVSALAELPSVYQQACVSLRVKDFKCD